MVTISLKEIAHDLVHVVFMPAAIWLWNERRVLKEILEDGLERRHENKGDKMINPLTIIQDVNLAVAAVEKLKAALPQIAKTVADLKQAAADKNDTTKLDADLAALLGDVDADLQLIAGLFPPAQTPPAAA